MRCDYTLIIAICDAMRLFITAFDISTNTYPAVTRCPARSPVSFTHSRDRRDSRDTATRVPPPHATQLTLCSACPARTLPGLLHTPTPPALRRSAPFSVFHTQPY